MKKLFFILICILICACEEQSYHHKMRTTLAAETASELIYVKDYRTNICYAMHYPQSNYGLMSTVPCTPEVEGLIVK